MVSVDHLFIFRGVRLFDVVHSLHAAPLAVALCEHARGPPHHHLAHNYCGTHWIFAGHDAADHCPAAFDAVCRGRRGEQSQFHLSLHLRRVVVGPFTLHPLGV